MDSYVNKWFVAKGEKKIQLGLDFTTQMKTKRLEGRFKDKVSTFIQAALCNCPHSFKLHFSY